MADNQFLYEVFSFYKFTPVKNPENFKNRHYEFCLSIGVKTRIIIAAEGINGVVSGTKEACRQYRKHLTNLPGFEDIHFKIDEVDQPYLRKVQVKNKPEIVNSGIESTDTITPLKDKGDYVDAEAFKQLKDREDVLILDVRSNYETEIGKFKNAVTLDIDNFREFPEKLDQLNRYKDKKVITYCTGGIKCEKVTALLKAEGFENVLQLSGGILQYAKEANGADFMGKCYVFDERITIDINQENPELISRCIHCGQHSARVINCANPDCNDQVIVCEDCGWDWKGACSEACMNHHRKRPYDGTGYYPKDKMLYKGFSGQ